MNQTKLIAYLTLFSGVFISVVAEYYSILGLTAIFTLSHIPIIIMGIAIGLAKLIATVWLKQNWATVNSAIKLYLVIAILSLMTITSIGIFGYLSKSHAGTSAVSSEVVARLAIIDEKIKLEKDNIAQGRSTLKQLDSQVDQVLIRSTSENGAAQSAAIRRSQLKERAVILNSIHESQNRVSLLNLEKEPISADLRKVELEVGPLKYLAVLFYGEADPTVLEKAVTWVILIIISVFDPLALILLLASQISFAALSAEKNVKEEPTVIHNILPTSTVRVVDSELVDPTPLVTTTHYNETANDEVLDVNPNQVATKIVETEVPITHNVKTFDWESVPPDQDYVVIDGQKMRVRAAKPLYPQTPRAPTTTSGYIQNEEQETSNIRKKLKSYANEYT